MNYFQPKIYRAYRNINADTAAATSVIEEEEEEVTEEEILLETPEDVERLLLMTTTNSQNNYRVRLADKLFGPPSWTLHWSDRRRLFLNLGQFGNLTALIVHGTIMGQVIPGHLLSLTMVAPRLQVFRVENGLVIDSCSYILDMAEALIGHKHLKEFSILNFLNHVIPIDVYLLDPLLDALSTIGTIEKLQLSCFSCFMHWQTSYLSVRALESFFDSFHSSNNNSNKNGRIVLLKSLLLTNLNLLNDQVEIIAKNMNTNPRIQLKELILNNNPYSKWGLKAILRGIQPTTLEHLEVENNVKLDTDLYQILHEKICSPSSQLKTFHCTYPVSSQLSSSPSPSLSFSSSLAQETIELQLRLNRMNLSSHYYSETVTPEQRVKILSNLSVLNDLDCLFVLLREVPSVCNLKMNAPIVLEVSSSFAWWRWKRWSLFVLWVIWMQFLFIGRENGTFRTSKRRVLKETPFVTPPFPFNNHSPSRGITMPAAPSQVEDKTIQKKKKNLFGPKSTMVSSKVSTTTSRQKRSDDIRSKLRQLDECMSSTFCATIRTETSQCLIREDDATPTTTTAMTLSIISPTQRNISKERIDVKQRRLDMQFQRDLLRQSFDHFINQSIEGAMTKTKE